jgi:SAM-dependent methyltransferase
MSHVCLACGGFLGKPLFFIPDLPLVDSFCESVNDAKQVPCFSIELCQCEICQTIQVASPPDTSDIYRNYIYESSSSPDLIEHFHEYANFIKKVVPDEGSAILEIGSNDGLLLDQLVKAGFSKLVGIDPSPQTAAINLPGVEIVNNFFDEGSTRHLPANRFAAIIANNCFSHIPHLKKVLELCKGLLERSGTLVVEVQSTLDLLEGVVFDYIYHEHYFYHTATSFERVAKMSGMELFSVKHVTTKGGSFRFLLGQPGQHPKDGSVDYWKFREGLVAIHTEAPWLAMKSYLGHVRNQLHDLLGFHPGKIVGYGACATGTVLLKYMGIETVISSIFDDNPKRQNRFAPRTAIPVMHPDSCEDADLCLLLAWRHSTHIVPKLVSRGIPYVIPLPALLAYG